MKTTRVTVQKEFCAECSLAISRFIGKMKGIDSVSAEDGRVVLTFDESEISEEDLLRITKENIERLGYRVL
ncbi:MAG: heavy-metal-associated domain-containing protein [Nitrospirae bacterium]|nr:heavy-metal-associated domain-containing protein [Nitrospirota bacterium]